VDEVPAADGELDARAGEGLEDGRVGIIELDPLDVERLEDAGDLRRGREVVRYLPVVDAELQWRRRRRYKTIG
jgi:hypothetical protein